MVIGKETQRQRKHHEISCSHPGIEHQATEKECTPYAPPLMFVQRRGHKSPQHIDYERESANGGGPARCRHVDEELRCQLYVDEVDMECAASIILRG